MDQNYCFNICFCCSCFWCGGFCSKACMSYLVKQNSPSQPIQPFLCDLPRPMNNRLSTLDYIVSMNWAKSSAVVPF